MLGKRSPQESLFSAHQEFFSFVGKDSFYCYLAEHRHEMFRDEDYALLYCADNGRASVPPSDLACALVLQWYDGVSDEEAAARAKYDLRWKVALGLELEKAPFAKSTLQLFRAQLIVHQQVKQLFEASLRHARARGYFKSRSITVALDTTPIFGRGAVEDTYNLLAEGLRQVLRVLAKVEQKPVETVAEEHDFRRYMAASFKGTVAINWDNESERQTVLTSLVSDCDRVLALVREALRVHADDATTVKEIEAAAEVLSKILAQDVHRTASGEAEIIEGVAPDRIVSVHDPEMRHGRKSASQRFDGYKGAIAVDTESQLITAVDVLAGNAHDAEDKQELLAETEQTTAAEVTTILGDTAYGSIEQRVRASETGQTLIAPVPRPPQTGRFTKEDFTIDLDTNSITCPAGQTTSTWSVKKHPTNSGKVFHNKAFRFAPVHCGPCPLRDRCISARSPSDKPGVQCRTVTVHEHEALLRDAKRMQQTEEFREVYRKRSLVEHRLARLVQLGVRQARYVGTAKVLFQLAMTAAVANLTLIAARAATDNSSLIFSSPGMNLMVATALTVASGLLLEKCLWQGYNWTPPQTWRFKTGGSRLGF